MWSRAKKVVISLFPNGKLKKMARSSTTGIATAAQWLTRTLLVSVQDAEGDQCRGPVNGDDQCRKTPPLYRVKRMRSLQALGPTRMARNSTTGIATAAQWLTRTLLVSVEDADGDQCRGPVKGGDQCRRTPPLNKAGAKRV